MEEIIKMKIPSIKIALIFIILITNKGYCQNYYTQKSVFLRTGLYYFYDNEPVIQVKRIKRRFELKDEPIILNPLSVGYQKQLNEKHFWALSLDMVYKYNLKHFYEMTQGHYVIRNFINFKNQYLYKIITKNKHHLFITTGLKFRFGKNVYFDGLKSTSTENIPVYKHKTLFDFGVLGGVKYQYYLGSHLSFNSQINHTYFVYSFDNIKERQVTYWSFGLSWNFSD